MDGGSAGPESPTPARRGGVSRRELLGASAVGLSGAAVGVVAGRASATESEPATTADDQPTVVPFHGRRQAGVTTVPQDHLTLVALDLSEDVDRPALVRMMRILTDDIGRLTSGEPALTDTEPELALSPARLTVTVGVGPRFFDLAGRSDQRPGWLGPLPSFAVDDLEERWSGGDVVLQICADDPITTAHAARILSREVRSFASVRWTQRGFRRREQTSEEAAATGGGSVRNLMGQVDGTRNLVMPADDPLVWIGEQSQAWFGPAPAWSVDGTAMVVRRIRMELDTWDEVDRPAREITIGRRLDNGAPLTGEQEHDEPDLEAVTDLGFPVIETFAHIRRARSVDGRQRFLRRPYNFDEAPEEGRTSNSGLVFITFQADVDAQFVPIQRRLDELDLLNQWTTPVGSAVFAVLPGCTPQSYLGAALLA